MGSTVYRILWLTFGIINPVYVSYKTIKDKNVKDYVRMMMFWIVFAVYGVAEVFMDFFLSWLPFYFELKVVALLWLVLPGTKGSTIVYTRFIHPFLLKRENDIDLQLDRLKEHCFNFIVYIGSKGFSIFTNLILTATIKGQVKLANHLKSLSLSDLTVESTTSFQETEKPAQVYLRNKTTPKRKNLLRSHTISNPSDYSEEERAARSDQGNHGNRYEKMAIIEENPELLSSTPDDDQHLPTQSFSRDNAGDDEHFEKPTEVHPSSPLVEESESKEFSPNEEGGFDCIEPSSSSESVLTSSLIDYAADDDIPGDDDNIHNDDDMPDDDNIHGDNDMPGDGDDFHGDNDMPGDDDDDDIPGDDGMPAADAIPDDDVIPGDDDDIHGDDDDDDDDDDIPGDDDDDDDMPGVGNSQKINEIVSETTETTLHIVYKTSQSETMPRHSNDQSAFTMIDKCPKESQKEEELSELFQPENINQSESEKISSPEMAPPLNTPLRPQTKSSSFTKTNFLKSFSFFDKKPLKSSKTFNKLAETSKDK